MLKVAIVDDEEYVREQLRTYVDQYAREEKLTIETVMYKSAAQLTTPYTGGFDIIFLDIDMPVFNGMNAAELIRSKDTSTVLVFVTNLAQYAVRGYEVDALDFIVKPVDYRPFRMRFARAIKRARKREDKSIILQTREGMKIVSVQDILWFEAVDHEILCHTKQGVWRMKNRLKNAEELVKNDGFARCNKYFLVNLRYVQAIRGKSVVVDGKELELSQRQEATFSEAALRYLGDVR